MARVIDDPQDSTVPPDPQNGAPAAPNVPPVPPIVSPESPNVPPPNLVQEISNHGLASPVVGLTFDQLLQLIDRAGQAASQGRGDTAELLKLAAESLNKVGEEVKRTVRRSNATHPGVSDFNPEGDEINPRPRLRHDTFFCGQREREDALSRFEIELYNKFERSTEAHGGRWKATLERNGTKWRLDIILPAKTNDDLASMPPLSQILSELLYGSEVADPSKAMERLANAEKLIQELQEKLAALAPRDNVAVPA